MNSTERGDDLIFAETLDQSLCGRACYAVGARLCAILFVLAASFETPAAHSEDYFKGKTLRIAVGTPPGGSYDAYARTPKR